jgi:hypothetical protein|tara:strand:+ start:320 stop:598 length:279 start_codon:yes stop_codon:yes gene_type:complete
MSPRPRSRDKVTPLSIGVPLSLMMRLDNELSYRQSRSKWVADAIIKKLDSRGNLDDFNGLELLQQLYYLEILTLDELKLFSARIDATQYNEF